MLRQTDLLQRHVFFFSFAEKKVDRKSQCGGAAKIFANGTFCRSDQPDFTLLFTKNISIIKLYAPWRAFSAEIPKTAGGPAVFESRKASVWKRRSKTLIYRKIPKFPTFKAERTQNSAGISEILAERIDRRKRYG